MQAKKSFASDNHAGVHPSVLESLHKVNKDRVPAYGHDGYTAQAELLFKEQFGEDAQAFMVCNGTAANVLSIAAVCKPHQAVICSSYAHIQNDECGAPGAITGCSLLPVTQPNAKLNPEILAASLQGRGDEHRVQARLLSLSQSTELGTVYSPTELKALTDFAHQQGLLVHMDGARLCNAAAHLKVPLRALTTDVGIDVLSFGGTKNGLMLAEAVVFLRSDLAKDFLFLRKQGMQLASKMRFIAAQFLAYFDNQLWLQNATHANAMARRLADGVAQISGIEITQAVQSNAVFARLPKAAIERLQTEYNFYVWDQARSEVRWMCAFDHRPEEIDAFLQSLRQVF